MKPYMVIAVGPGSADVVDRSTLARVGYVLQNYYLCWEPFVTDEDGIAPGRPLGHLRRYRAEAAADVWTARGAP